MILDELKVELRDLKAEAQDRDQRMNKIRIARTPGGLNLVYPDLFPTDGPYSEPMVANMVDIAARDTAEVIAPLPTFTCRSASGASDRASRFADKRTKICYGYVESSRLQIQLYSAVDQYVTYGFMVGAVRLDFKENRPQIKFYNPQGCYFVRDDWGRVVRLYQSSQVPYRTALALYPELEDMLRRSGTREGSMIELVRWHDRSTDGVFCSTGDGQVVSSVPNPVGKVLAHVFVRPGLTNDQIGQFDDVIAVQAAKARFATLTLEAAAKAVQAPLAVPMDMQEFAIGPDAVLKSANPQAIKRVGIDVPQAAFIQQRELDNELRQGSRYPDVRTGNTDASVVTGRGVQALQAGFDTQVATAHAIIAEGLQFLLSRCFEVDEKVWPDRTATVNGSANGAPYEITYTPAKDIKGDYTVDVQYGLMAGLNPNQALIFGLQARGDKLFSRNYLRTQLPFPLDASEEEQRVDVEDFRESLKAAMEQLAQTIPMIAQGGGDPTVALQQMASIILDRQKGVPIEDAVAKAFAPKPAPPAPEPAPAMQPDLGGMNPADPTAGMLAQQGGAPQGGDFMSLIAGIGASGNPNMSAGVQRRLPV